MMKKRNHIIVIIVVREISGTRKEGCKYMVGNGLCGKNPACTSSGECEAHVVIMKDSKKPSFMWKERIS